MNGRVLLTGFEPFGGNPTNVSWDVVAAVNRAMPTLIYAQLLPVDYLQARLELTESLAEKRPAACLCLGLGRPGSLGVETKARKPEQFRAFPGPEILETAWPAEEILSAAATAQLPARISEDAGQYVCESTFWAALDFRERLGQPEWVGFVHLPPETAVFTLERLVQCITDIVRRRPAVGGCTARGSAHE
ncbi:MAG: hypothetical protein HN380_31750 [Victivallales bacterium]|nr:hypothetical protein [Victivallales bacterium]